MGGAGFWGTRDAGFPVEKSRLGDFRLLLCIVGIMYCIMIQ